MRNMQLEIWEQHQYLVRTEKNQENLYFDGRPRDLARIYAEF